MSENTKPAAAVAPNAKLTHVAMGAQIAGKAGQDVALKAALAKGFVANRKLLGKVVAVWGEALIRHEDGTITPLQAGDVVKPGDMVLTSQDGIVQIEGSPALANLPSLDRVIGEINQGNAEVAPAAGAGDGTLQPGIRVDRVVEDVTPAGLQLSPIPASSFVVQIGRAHV